MSKTKILADTVSNGNILADGAISASEIGTGTLAVANGGTGATTLTGVVKANGTAAFTAGNVSLTSEVTGTLPVANGGTGATSLTVNNVLLGNGTSAVQVVAPGTSGNVLTSNGTTWTSAAAPNPLPLTLLSTTTISSSTSFYEQTGLQSFSDYEVHIFYLNCTQGNPSGYIINTDATTTTWGGNYLTRSFGLNSTGGSWTSQTDTDGNRVWVNSGPIPYLVLRMSGFGTAQVAWSSFYVTTGSGNYYGWQLGRSSNNSKTCGGFRITFPSAATSGTIQFYRRG